MAAGAGLRFSSGLGVHFMNSYPWLGGSHPAPPTRSPRNASVPGATGWEWWMATEEVRRLFSCLGVSLRETPILDLAVLTDSPKAEPWGAAAPQGSVLGVVDRFRTRSLSILTSHA